MNAATHGPRGWRPSFTSLLLVALGFLAIDWFMPPGIAVGLLLMLPIVATSFLDSPAATARLLLVCFVVKLLESFFGPTPITEPAVWVTNRLLVVGSWLSAWAVAGAIRRLRLHAELQRNRALNSSHLNRLLISLVAHDFRSPLTLVRQTLDYAIDRIDASEVPDASLLRDVRTRVDRGIDDSERLIRLVESELQRGDDNAVHQALPLREHLEREINSFTDEARRAGKTISAAFDLDDGWYSVDTVVLRHLLGVLLENALVHAAPGQVSVRCTIEQQRLVCAIQDPGPNHGGGGGHGMGKGLHLASEIATSYGGDLSSDLRHGGSIHRLNLPVVRVPASGR